MGTQKRILKGADMNRVFYVKLSNWEARDTYRCIVGIANGDKMSEYQATELAVTEARNMAPVYSSSWEVDWVCPVCNTSDNVNIEL